MFTINAEVRKEQGKGASRRLRAANKFPAIIYGGSEAPIAIELDHDQVMNMQAKAEFYSEVLTLVVDGKEVKVKLRLYSVTLTTEADSHRLRSRVIAWKLRKTRPGGVFYAFN
ncbi:50S ribosomal protein L25 [Salmonella enterica subsp. enterica serovar Heidelberg str. RI-11-014316]|nr:50S ribosomal protein L25 [Salmonella enterica subsp. enterica serovar Heidelberg str. RI-11-014316]